MKGGPPRPPGGPGFQSKPGDGQIRIFRGRRSLLPGPQGLRMQEGELGGEGGPCEDVSDSWVGGAVTCTTEWEVLLHQAVNSPCSSCSFNEIYIHFRHSWEGPECVCHECVCVCVCVCVCGVSVMCMVCVCVCVCVVCVWYVWWEGEACRQGTRGERAGRSEQPGDWARRLGFRESLRTRCRLL